MTRALSDHARGQVEAVAHMLAADVEAPAIRAALAQLVTENGNGSTPAASSSPARRLDTGALLDAPLAPIPYRCDKLAADGFVTVIAGHGGEGKSWLALGLSIGVACGSTVAGIRCEKGTALYLDGENGERLIARRYRAAAGPRENVAIYEAEAIDLANREHAAWLAQLIHTEGAQLVVLDSLRSLAPHLIENDGDTVAPVMHHLRRIARTTGAAVIVLHHRPKAGGAAYRGSSVLRDQADILAVLGRHEKDEKDTENSTRRYLHADGARGGKFRIDAEPADRWLHLRPHGEHVTLDPADPPTSTTTSDRPPTVTETVAADLADLLANHPTGLSRPDLARALDRTPGDGTVRRALDLLAANGTATRTGPLWTLASQPGTPAGTPAEPLPAKPPIGGLASGTATATPHDPDPDLAQPYVWWDRETTP